MISFNSPCTSNQFHTGILISRHITVIYAHTFDEPVGGLMNVLLTEDGQHYQYPQIVDGRSLVIDVGGFTTDFLAVNQGGEVDCAFPQSVPLGIQSVIRGFEESFRANGRKKEFRLGSL